MGKRASTFLMIAIVAVILLAALLLINRTTIFQEGNPLPVFGGVWHLVVGGDPYAVVKKDPPVWITKAGKHDELFSAIERTYGIKYSKQVENGYLFEGNGKKVTVAERQYSRSFQIWEASSSTP